ncbi:leucine-rich repeat domain-containing protein [Leptospira interrogans]|uniref:Leucine-rich repeat domain-containing protein n=1 Tax=Leptospira interrogans TaxID=173 RepID=A0AAV9FV21_LEPIR|nr:leucine-rich repeat domain-containing protein [Leptospira interrogans]KAK2617062.1 leucine-rich repeat domain-containing protein [Leptospira interrogans]
MNFRIMLIHLQKITIGFLFLINLFCKIQTEKVEPKTYRDLTEAIQNPLDVRFLYLNGQKLTTLPKEIGQLKNLQRLDLGYNQFKIIPNEIEQLQNLQVLELNNNQLTTLSKEIGRLQNLQELYLSYNQLTILPNEIGQLKNLQVLELNNNQLKTLSKEIGQLKNLKRLELDNNQLSSEEKERIRKLLPKCKIYFE